MQIVVLGMHRSGTSAVARLLNLMGAYFGAENVSTGASEENEKGFWERLDVRALNDSMLHNANGDWDRIADLDLDAIPDDMRTAYHGTARDIVLNLDAHRPWFVKEPRLCVLLPLWRPVLELPFCVHVFRHPMEVAQSLKARNGIPIKAGLALWEAYNTKAIAASADLPRVFLSYEELLGTPEPVVTRLRETLASSSGYSFRVPSSAELGRALDPDLRHQHVEEDGGTASLTKGQVRMHKLLIEAVASPDIRVPRMSATCRDTLRRFESGGEHLAARKRRSNSRQRASVLDADPRLALKSMELDQALKVVGEKSTALAEAGKRTAALTKELHGKDTDLVLKSEAVDRLNADIEHRRRVLAARDQKIEELQSELRNQSAAIAKSTEANDNLVQEARRSKADLENRHADLAAAKAGNEGLALELRESKADLKAQRAKLESANEANERLVQEAQRVKADLAARDETNQQLSAHTQKLDAEATQKDEAIERLKKEIHELKSGATSREDTMAELTTELAELRTSFASKSDALDSVSTEVERLNATSTSKDESLAKLYAEFADLETGLKSRDETIISLSSEASAEEAASAMKDEALEELTAENRRGRADVASLEQTVRRLTDETRQMRAELASRNQVIAANSVTVDRLRDEMNRLERSTQRAVKKVTDENIQLADDSLDLKRQKGLVTDRLRRLEADREIKLQQLAGLETRHRELVRAIDAILRSRRWRLGHFLLSLRHRLLFRRVPPMATDTIERLSEIDGR